MQTDSSLSEPGEPRLRIALSCRRTHCIRTLYPHSLESGSKVSNLEIRLLLVFVCTLSAYLIGLPHVIASRDCMQPPPLLHFNSIQFNSIQFYLYRAITIQLSLGALQSPEPETPLVQAQWQNGQEKTPCYSGRNLKRNHGT